jgi:integrase
MEQGEMISEVTFRKRFNKVREAADLTPHGFRHGYMQLSRQVGAEPLATEAIMGHALPSMLAIYGSGYDVPTMQREMQKVWARIDDLRWVKV